MKNLGTENIKIKCGFWNFYNELDKNAIVKSVYDRFKETGRFDALKCNWREGKPNPPHIFWDSDSVKWIEGVGYLLLHADLPEWEAKAACSLISSAFS